MGLVKLSSIKSGKSDLGKYIIYSSIEEEIYTKKLHCFKALSKLSKICADMNNHQLIWAKYIHLFPNNFIPPIRVPYHSSLKDICFQDIY